jgi:hypothetical protein
MGLGAFIVRQLVNEGGAAFHRPELRGHRLAVDRGDAQPQIAGRASASAKRRRKAGLPSSGFQLSR